MTDTMKDVDHTHPHGDSGAARSFRRGPAVAADGSGRPSDRADEQTTESDDESMADVDHQPPEGDGANPVFERGKKPQAERAVEDVSEDEE